MNQMQWLNDRAPGGEPEVRQKRIQGSSCVILREMCVSCTHRLQHKLIFLSPKQTKGNNVAIAQL